MRERKREIDSQWERERERETVFQSNGQELIWQKNWVWKKKNEKWWERIFSPTAPPSFSNATTFSLTTERVTALSIMPLITKTITVKRYCCAECRIFKILVLKTFFNVTECCYSKTLDIVTFSITTLSLLVNDDTQHNAAVSVTFLLVCEVS